MHRPLSRPRRGARGARLGLAWALAASACLGSTQVSNVDLGGTTVVLGAANVPLGGAPATVTLTTRQSDGHPVGLVPLQISAPGCSVAAAARSAADGTLAAALRCSQGGQVLVAVSSQLSDAVVALPIATSLNVYAPADGQSAVASGAALNVQAVAADGHGGVVTSYAGHVHVTSTDPNATLPNDYIFTAVDHGVKVWQNALVLRTPGTQTVTVTDSDTGAVLAHDTYGVSGGEAARLELVISLTASAAAPQAVTLRVLDSGGEPAQGYRGTVAFTSSDRQAILPPPITFAPGDGGVYDGATVTWGTAGLQALSAMDTARAGLQSAVEGIVVGAGPPAQLTLTGPVAALAGAALNVVAHVADAFGNPTNAFGGTLQLTAADPQASLPGNVAMAGQKVSEVTLAGLVLRTAGSVAVTVQDTAALLRPATLSLPVRAAPASRLALTAPAAAVAGVGGDVVATAYDTFGNVASGYAGTVVFTATDARAAVPHAHTFIAADAGTHAVPAVLVWRTSGAQTLGVVDALNAALQAQQGVSVAPAATAALQATVSRTAQAGTPLAVGVAAVDAFGNVTPSFAGTLHLACTDPYATLHADAPYTGTLSLTSGATLTSGGMQRLTLQDTANPTLSAVSVPITVTAGPVSVVGSDAGRDDNFLTQGSTFAPTLYFQDAYGNAAVSYAGSLTVSSTDPTVDTTPVTVRTSDQGQVQVFATMQTLGGQAVTFADSQNNLTATFSVEVYYPAASIANSLSFGGVSNVPNAGQPYGLTGPPSLAIDAGDQPWLAWSDNRSGGFQPYLARYSGGAWVGVAGSLASTGLSPTSGDNVGTRLGLDANNVPTVAWRNVPSGSSANALLTAKVQGGAWAGLAGSQAPPGLTGSAATAQDALALVVGSKTFVAWRAADAGVHVWASSGGAFAAVGPQPVATGKADAYPVALALDASDRPAIAWAANSGNLEVYVAHYSGSAWQGYGTSNVGAGISANAGASQNPSLAFDPNGLPYVAWDDDTSGTPQIYLRMYNGSSWVALAGSASGGGISNDAGPAQQPRVAVSAAGVPGVAWVDGSVGHGSAYFASYRGGAWQAPHGFAARYGLSAATAFQFVGLGSDYRPVQAVDLAFTGSGTPLIAYQQSSGVYLAVGQ